MWHLSFLLSESFRVSLFAVLEYHADWSLGEPFRIHCADLWVGPLNPHDKINVFQFWIYFSLCGFLDKFHSSVLCSLCPFFLEVQRVKCETSQLYLTILKIFSFLFLYFLFTEIFLQLYFSILKVHLLFLQPTLCSQSFFLVVLWLNVKSNSIPFLFHGCNIFSSLCEY